MRGQPSSGKNFRPTQQTPWETAIRDLYDACSLSAIFVLSRVEEADDRNACFFAGTPPRNGPCPDPRSSINELAARHRRVIVNGRPIMHARPRARTSSVLCITRRRRRLPISLDLNRRGVLLSLFVFLSLSLSLPADVSPPRPPLAFFSSCARFFFFFFFLVLFEPPCVSLLSKLYIDQCPVPRLARFHARPSTFILLNISVLEVEILHGGYWHLYSSIPSLDDEIRNTCSTYGHEYACTFPAGRRDYPSLQRACVGGRQSADHHPRTSSLVPPSGGTPACIPRLKQTKFLPCEILDFSFVFRISLSNGFY